MIEIIIVDLGTGNLRSVSKALEHVGDNLDVRISGRPEDIASAEYLVLPGQGAIGTWMAQLKKNPELELSVTQRLGQGPVLGICLGLQALYEYSEENGGTDGLGLIPGNVVRFPENGKDDAGRRLKVPHMGWNQVSRSGDHPLWHGIADNERFYFVHSYYAASSNGEFVAGSTEYGTIFTAAAAFKNIFATQFHPEKSQRAGLRLLENFVNWNGES